MTNNFYAGDQVFIGDMTCDHCGHYHTQYNHILSQREIENQEVELYDCESCQQSLGRVDLNVLVVVNVVNEDTWFEGNPDRDFDQEAFNSETHNYDPDCGCVDCTLSRTQLINQRREAGLHQDDLEYGF